MAFNDLLLKALHKEKTERPPVWLMRQAGRYMPEYMEVRKKVTFLELCKTPELACDVTLQPIDILGADAAILFSDILIPIEPVGIDLNFNPAPVISNPVRTQDDINKLRKLNPESDVPFVYKTIDLLIKKLDVPLIGFSGAPFTLACYMTEGAGSKSFIEIRKMMLNSPALFHSLMSKLTEDTIKYLQAQVSHDIFKLKLAMVVLLSKCLILGLAYCHLQNIKKWFFLMLKRLAKISLLHLFILQKMVLLILIQ